MLVYSGKLFTYLTLIFLIKILNSSVVDRKKLDEIKHYTKDDKLG